MTEVSTLSAASWSTRYGGKWAWMTGRGRCTASRPEWQAGRNGSVCLSWGRSGDKKSSSFKHVLSTSPIYSVSATTRTTRRLVFTAQLRPRSECPQFGMPAERHPQFRVPNMPRSRISEHAPFRIYEHAHVEFLNVPVCSAPMSYLAGSKWGRPLCYGHAAACWCLQRARGACGGRIALDGGVASILALWP